MKQYFQMKDNTFSFFFFLNPSSKQHLVVLMEDDTTLSLAERQIKMHPDSSPAPPPAICSSLVISLEPPSPINKLFVHLCYKQGYWNNQGFKWAAERKQNLPKGRWLTSDGATEQSKEMHPSQGWGNFLLHFGHWRKMPRVTTILVMNSAISQQIPTSPSSIPK